MFSKGGKFEHLKITSVEVFLIFCPCFNFLIALHGVSEIRKYNNRNKPKKDYAKFFKIKK